jgi:hypothetical protein
MADQAESSNPHVNEYESETEQLMQSNSPQIKSTSPNGSWFTLDDIPISKQKHQLN